MKELLYDEWNAEGRTLFGDDMLKWRFECPVCKHVAASEDFRAYKERGATPDSATQECLGRYLAKEQRATQLATEGSTKQPCDYAGYGLFRLSPIVVVMPDGERRHSFAFAAPEAKP